MKIITLFKLVIGYVIFWLSFFVPRNDNTWIFIGWHKNKEGEIFADNSKYFFLFVSQNVLNVKAIWIGKDNKIVKMLRERGLKAYSINNILGIYYSLTAGYTIIDAFIDLKNWRYSGRSKIIQLWHGKSTKKTGFDSPYSLKRYNPLLFPNLFIKPIFMIAASPLTKKLHSSSFNMPEKKIYVTGLPKHVAINHKIIGMEIDTDQNLKEQMIKSKETHPNETILFAPTFRPDGTTPLESINLDKMNTRLKENGQLLFITMHPKFAMKDQKSRDNFENIVFVKSDFDIYPLLHLFDAMISDYSSIVLEFLLLDKPVILYAPDLDKYKKDMGIHEEIWALEPGPIIKTSDELLCELSQIKKNKLDFEKKRKDALKVLFTYEDNKSSERIVDIIKNKKWKKQ